MFFGEGVQAVHLVGEHHVGDPAVDDLLERGRHSGSATVVDDDDREAVLGPPLAFQPGGPRRDHLLVTGGAADVHQHRQSPAGGPAGRDARGQAAVGHPLERGARRDRVGAAYAQPPDDHAARRHRPHGPVEVQ
jgi:hypothetical protein